MKNDKKEWLKKWKDYLEYRELSDSGQLDYVSDENFDEPEVPVLREWFLREWEDLGKGWTLWADDNFNYEEKVKKGSTRYKFLLWFSHKKNELLSEEAAEEMEDLRDDAEQIGGLEVASMTGELARCPECGRAMSAVSDENGKHYRCKVCGFQDDEWW